MKAKAMQTAVTMRTARLKRRTLLIVVVAPFVVRWEGAIRCQPSALYAESAKVRSGHGGYVLGRFVCD
jgi:hypothetical protein